MNKNEMFVTATRNKFRFPFRGQISVEDLWDLSVENLDSVYKTLNSQVKKAKEESLLNTKSREDEIIEMQIEIVKYIVSVKQDESAKKVAATEKSARKQKILKVLAAKEDADLQNKSPEELQAMLAALDDNDE